MINALRIAAVSVTVLMTLLANSGCAAQFKSVAGVSQLGYSTQVGAFSEVSNAERLTVALQRKGLEAFYFRKDNGIYVVRFGDYPSRYKAKQAAEKLVAEKIVERYFIVSPAAVFSKETRRGTSGSPEKSLPVKNKGTSGDMGAVAARTAERFVGIPYRWGGENVVDGMDCSGFVRAVYNLCGVNIPRTSAEQFKTGETVGREELVDGDLVFFGTSSDSINHVGIYAGGGKFVHAPRRGEEIRVSTLDEKYFSDHFVGAKRYFGLSH